MRHGKGWVASVLGAGVVATAVVASAQTVPTARDQVARPGGQVAGLPALALVKVADGFNDPVGVTSANDGTGRIFVVERVGRIKVVAKDGRVMPEFLDLTKTNPLGSEVQTGFVEQGLWSVAFHSKFKDNGHLRADRPSRSLAAHLRARGHRRRPLRGGLRRRARRDAVLPRPHDPGRDPEAQRVRAEAAGGRLVTATRPTVTTPLRTRSASLWWPWSMVASVDRSP